jgi:predicted permease
LIRQLVTETMVVAVAGGLVGVLLAALVLEPLFAFVSGLVPTNARENLNLLVLVLTLAVSLGSGLLVGLVPALRLSRLQLTPGLSRASRSHGESLSRRGTQVLIAAEVALTIVVIAGAGLFIRSYLRMTSVDPGFDRDAVVAMDVAPIDQDNDAAIAAFYPALLRAVRAQPDTAAAGFCMYCFRGNAVEQLTVAGETERIRVAVRAVTPGTLEALDLSLRLGRLPEDRDLGVKPVPVVLTETAARRLFGGRPAVGAQLQGTRGAREVIGIVSDVNFQAPFESDRPDVFQVSADAHPVTTTLLVRPRASDPNVLVRLRETAQALGMPAVIDKLHTVRDRPNDRVEFAGERTLLAGALAVLSLALALVGVFGMTAFAVARRVREIGVRVALGATPRRIVLDSVLDSAVPAAAGLVVGLVGAALSTRVIASFLFKTSATDAGTFAMVSVGLGLGACLAAWIPARRAARVDPVKALAAE